MAGLTSQRTTLEGSAFTGKWLPLEEVVRPFGETGHGITFLDGRDSRTWSYHELAGQAAGVAHRLQASGVRPGDRIALTITNDLPSVLALMAIWAAGGAVVSLPPPSHRTGLSYGQHFGKLLSSTGCRFIITDSGDEAASVEGDGITSLPKSGLCAGPGMSSPAAPASGDAEFAGAALIQFTSGSVSRPKGVEISARTLARHLGAVSQSIGLNQAEDRVVSWLPLYHDMGLVAMFLTAVMMRANLTLMPPATFAYGPARWLTVLAEQGGTVTAAPDFAYRMAAAVPYPDGLDLSRVRASLCGGERITWQTLLDFGAATERFGFSWEAIMPSYGLAESVVGATTTPWGRGPALGPGGHVSVGLPLPGILLEAPEGLPAGPISLGGEWVFSGYHTDGGFEAVPAGGWFDTGDHGFIHDGQFYVLGRQAEVAAAAGRNVFAEDIESAVYEGHGTDIRVCAAFRRMADDNTFNVMAEVPTRPKRSPAELSLLGTQVRSTISRVIGIRVHSVLIVRPGTIPRTSSGKVQRAQCRELLTRDGLARRLLTAVE